MDGAPRGRAAAQGWMRMKFTKLTPVRRYRIFRNFTWGDSLPELARYNIFYGWNGSGKTTLSSIFQAIERSTALETGECEIYFEGGSIRGADFASDRIRPAVRVFNRAYVDSTVFRSGTPGVPPIYFVAEGGADKQRRIEEIGLALRGKDGKGGLDAEFAVATKAVERANADFDNFTIERATEVREELRSGGQNAYNNYDKRSFRGSAERWIQLGDAAIEGALLDEKMLRELRQKKNATLLDAIELIGLPVVDVSALALLTKQVIAKTVVSSAIEALTQNPRVEQWVRTGLPLHGMQSSGLSAKDCLFCNQPLSQERVAQLEAHFNDSYQLFINELDGVMAEVARAEQQLANVALPKTSELSEHLRETYVAARENLEALYIDQQAQLRWLQEAMSEKTKAPFKQLELASYVKEDARGKESVEPYISELRRLVGEHNRGVSNFEQTVSGARTSIENGIVAKALKEYTAKKDAPKALQKSVDAVQENRKLLQEEAARLDREIRQHNVPADELNSELRSYLGRDELKFSVEGSGYSIERSGVRATNLSEGEKTAIAFLYFLKSLSGTSFDLKNGVVVIDDPVSSLDANSLFCSFAYMSKKTVDAKQLIIFTHNFLFLKQVKDWFSYLKPEAQYFMVESYMEPDGRAARIARMDKLLKDHQSEYHYLFRRVLQGSLMDQGHPLETYYGHPNMARRLLEIFLGFRFPAKKDFHKRLDALKSDPAVLARIRRFVHTYSHEEGDGEDIDATMLAEAPAILAAILEAIRLEDPGHHAQMTALCAAADQSDAAHAA
jgi:wobble nucleotide-excising tRNase